MNRMKIAAAAGLIVAAAGTASAAPSIGYIPGGATANDFITTFFNANTRIEGWYGANVYLVAAGPVTITAEYFGAEAGYRNSFTLTGGAPVATACGSPSFSHGGGTTFAPDANAGVGSGDAIATCTATQNPGLLSFSYLLNGGAASLANGTNNPFNISPNFFVSFDNNYALDTAINQSTAGSGQSVFLFLDDGGAGPDDNHDDMVIRLSITGGYFTVPEPGALALVGLALTGLGLARRRVSRG